MRLTLCVFALLCVTSTLSEEIQSFNGYKAIHALAENVEQAQALFELQKFGFNGEELDFWTEVFVNANTDIMIAPSQFDQVMSYLAKLGIKTEVYIENVGKLIEEEQPKGVSSKAMDWNAYHTLASIYDWLDELQRLHPNLVEVTSLGNSTEGRPVKMIKISRNNGIPNKPAFFLDSTIHAREWIAPAVGTYIINQLTTNSSAHEDFLSNIDFYIVPVLNPDGYAYTHDFSRMWRKSRSNHNSPIGCRGVDLNRNYDYMWNSCSGCSSGDLCSDTYRGPRAFSEPEADAHKNFMLNSGINWQVYISLHSYGLYFMSPWGYTSTLPEDYAELKEMSDYVAGNITSLYGMRFRTGASGNILYPTDGTSADWARGSIANIKWAYTAELRGSSFVLPVDQIIPSGEEMWFGLQVILRHLVNSK